MLPSVWSAFHLRKIFQVCRLTPSLNTLLISLLDNSTTTFQNTTRPTIASLHSDSLIEHAFLLLMLPTSDSTVPLRVDPFNVSLFQESDSSAIPFENFTLTPRTEDLHTLNELLQIPFQVGPASFFVSMFDYHSLPAEAIQFVHQELQQNFAETIAVIPELPPTPTVSLNAIFVTNKKIHIAILLSGSSPQPVTLGLTRHLHQGQPIDLTQPLLQAITNSLILHLLRTTLQTIFQIPYHEKTSFHIQLPLPQNPLYFRLHMDTHTQVRSFTISHSELSPPRQTFPLEIPAHLLQCLQVIQHAHTQLTLQAVTC